MSESSPEQRYGPTSGTVTGVTGLLCCVVVVAAVVAGGFTPTSTRVALAALALGVLAWAFLLRPRIIVEEGGRTLLLRNPLVSHRVPLAAVKVVGVRTVTTVKTENDERFDAVAVGYALRKVVRGTAGGVPTPREASAPRAGDQSIQRLMEDRILAAADRARALGQPAEPVERRFAVVEIGLLVALVVAFAVSFAF